MSIQGLMVQPVTIENPGVIVDDYGNSIDDWDAGTTVATTAWIAQRSGIGGSQELTIYRAGESSEWIGFFNPTVVINHKSRVTRGSMVFEVNGTPNPAYRYNELHHYEVPLTVVAG